MAIFEETMYGVQCDRCKKIYEEYHSGSTVFVDKESVMEAAQDDNWLIEDSKCYCPDCYECGEDDEITIKPTQEDDLPKDERERQLLKDFYQ